MTDELRSKILSFTAANISAQVATTLTGIFLARTLSLEDLGSYRQVILLVSTGGGIFALGLPLSLFYFLPRLEARDERARFAGQTLLLLSGIGLVVALLAVGLSSWIALRLNNPALEGLIPVAAPLFFTGLLVKYVAPVFLSLDRARLAGIFRLIQSFSVSGVLVALVAMGFPLARALVGMAVAEGLSLLVAYRLQHRILPLRLGMDPSLLKPQLLYALPLGLSGMVGLLSRQVDQFMISAFMDPGRFALYSVGATEVPIVPLLVGSAGSVILPRLAGHFAAGEKDGYARLFQGTQRKLALLCIPVTVGFMALARPFLVFLYGEEFSASVWVFRIYGLIQLNRLFLFGFLLQSLGLTRIVLLGEVVFMTLNVVGNYFLLRWIGFLGPALATEAAGLVIMSFNTWYVGWRKSIPRRQLYAVGDIARILGVSAVSGGAAAWAATLPHGVFLQLVVGGLVYLPLVLGGLMLLGVLRADERPWDILRRRRLP